MRLPEHLIAHPCPPWCARSVGHGPDWHLADLDVHLIDHEAPVLADAAGLGLVVRQRAAFWWDGVLDVEDPRVAFGLDPSRDFTPAEARQLAAALVTAAEVLEFSP